MPLGFREDRRRRRRRTQWLVFKWLVAFALVIAAGGYAYEMGKRLAATELTRQRDQIETLTARVGELETRNTSQRAEVAAAETTAQNWQQLYERDVARGPTKELFELIQHKLASGVEADRLKTVLTATQNRRDCRREAERRKFPLPTRARDATNASLNFANGEVTVVAFGTPAKDEKGNEESWFDPAQPVTARLIRGRSTVAEQSGAMPLVLTQIIGEREYRFTIDANKLRGTVDITSESCRFP